MSTRLTLRAGKQWFFLIVLLGVTISMWIVIFATGRVVLPAYTPPATEAPYSSCGKMPSITEKGDFQITYLPNGRRIVDPRCGFICYTNDSYERQSIYCYKYGD